MGVGESSLESIEYYCIFWGKKKSVEDKEWAVGGGILGIDVGEASALLYQNVKTQISCPQFFHFKCKMLDMGTLLRAGKDKEAVELMETTSYIGKGERWREGVVREFEMDTYMLLYLKWITNKDQLYIAHCICSMYVAACMVGSLEENGYMYMYGQVHLLST